MTRPRVAITGMGVKTPAGCDLDTFWETLKAGRSAAAPIRRVDPASLPVRFACEVTEFDPTTYFDTKEARRTDRVAQLGFAAAADALSDAGDPGADPARCAPRPWRRSADAHYGRADDRRARLWRRLRATGHGNFSRR